MTNAELIQKIRAEIERLKVDYLNRSYTFVPVAMEHLLDFLSTIEESEKPMNQDEDLNKEIKAFVNEYGYEKSEDILLIAIVARHFAKWGAEHLANSNDEVVINGHKVEYDKDKDAITMEAIPNDLEEAANEYAYRGLPDEMKPYVKPVGDEVIKNFIAGAKWDRQQMLKEAVEGTVMDFSSNQPRPQVDVYVDPNKYCTGDKVRVIVLPKEDEK